jgi:hypothetical protein
MLQPAWILAFPGQERAPKLGAICRCPDHARNSGVLPTRTPSLDFVRALGCAGSLAIRRRGSSHSFGGQKNGVRYVWDGAPELVRSTHAADPRSVLRRHTGLPRTRCATRPLPALWQGEARAPGLSGGQPVLHEAVRLLRRPALSQCHDPGRGQRPAPGLAHGQGTRQAVHAGATGPGGNAGPQGHRHRRDLDP